MNAQELRIGNLFYPINRSREVHLPYHIAYKIMSIGPFEVQALLSSRNPAQHEWVKFDINDLSPIPLTPEILEKVGFKATNLWYRMQLILEKHQSIFNGIIYSDLKGASIEHYEHVSAVHQLQNLIFAATGEELEIKALAPTS